MKTSKILSSTFYKAHGSGANLTYYHNITVEGIDKQLNIGAKSQNPDFLQPGQTLNWEWKDEAKGSIKKVVPQTAPGQGHVSAPVTDTTGLKISTGLTVATMMYVAGKIKKEQVNDIAANVVRKFDEIKAML